MTPALDSNTFDVVVVGAGPAGAAAACALASSGMRVALLDKAKFPRDKLCGGLLSQRSMRIIGDVFGACELPIECTTTGAAVFVKDALAVRIQDCTPLRFTSRRKLDACFVAAAVARSATLFEGAAMAAIDFATGRVALSDGTVLSTTFIVGADGASSRVRKLAGVSIDRRGFAVGLEADVPRADVRRDVQDPEVYFGIAEWGYGWVFPKRDTLTVGIGGLAHENADLQAAFRELASTALGAVPDRPVFGSPIPFGNFVGCPGRGSTLLVGDAAGLVEPLTGEGIAFAVLSGAYAAKAIVEAARLEAPSRALGMYLPLYRSIASSFDDVRVLRRLVFSRYTKRLFHSALGSDRRVVAKHMDVLAGNTEYRDYARFAVAATVANLPRIVRAGLRPHRGAHS
jgi:geranylgeranyl reductase family protein